MPQADRDRPTPTSDDQKQDTRRGRPAPKKKKGKPSSNTRPSERYYFPVGTSKYRISQHFGNPSSRYKSGRHQGVDIAVPEGTPIVSTTSGTVIFVGNAGAHGLRVGVRDAAGRVHYYGHLSKFNVRVGDKVAGGALLAYSGNTGKSTGPHLHYQVEENGRPIDPSFILGSNVAVKTGYGSSRGGGSYSSGAGGVVAAGQAGPQTRALMKARFRFPFDVSRFIDAGLRSGLSGGDLDDYVYSLIVNSPEFDNFYPGIKRRDGTLILSPVEYTEYLDAIQSTAVEHSFQLSKQQVGQLLQRGVSPQEAQVRFRAAQIAITRPDVLQALRAQINDMNSQRAKLGLDPIRQVSSAADVIRFFSQEGDRDVYDAYEAAQTASVARSFGLDVSNARAREIAAATEGVMSIEEQQERYGEIARRIRVAGVDLREFGVTQRDLEVLEFGGANQGRIAQAAEQALAQAEAKKNAEQASAFADVDSGRPVLVGRREAGL